MKKAITIILIITMIITAIPYNRVCAKDIAGFNEIESGTTIRGEDKAQLDTSISGTNLIGSILTYLILAVTLPFQALLTLAIMPEYATKLQLFTIEDLVFGRFELFNINFMNIANSNKSIEYISSSTNVLIKINVAEWFYAIRNFAIVALLAVLIYIGILMAISSIASDKAKYKNMLIHWVVSFAILMILPYIMAFAINVSETSVNIIRGVAENVLNETVDNNQIEQTKGLNFEKTLLYGKVDAKGNGFEGILTRALRGNSWESCALAIVYTVIIYYQIKFFFMYLKRMLTVGFLIVISPLITITYSIDKAGDNQAQAYNTWLKEFLVNVFIQPLHALLFIVFMYSIYGIMQRAPLLAIVFLASLSRGEKIVRNLFKIDRTSSFRGLRKK